MNHFCYLCFVFVMISCLFIAALWPPAGKGLTYWLYVCDVLLCFVTYPFGVLGQVCYLIVSISDLCLLTSFHYCLTRHTYMSVILKNLISH